MAVYKISENAGYHGCGKAWAAIDNDGLVVGLRYMGACPAYPTEGLEAWQVAVLSNLYKRSGVAKKAAIDAGHPGVGPRGGYLGEKRLIDEALSARKALSSKLFAEHREKSRNELAKLGAVMGGMCSCREFVA